MLLPHREQGPAFIMACKRRTAVWLEMRAALWSGSKKAKKIKLLLYNSISHLRHSRAVLVRASLLQSSFCSRSIGVRRCNRHHWQSMNGVQDGVFVVEPLRTMSGYKRKPETRDCATLGSVKSDQRDYRTLPGSATVIAAGWVEYQHNLRRTMGETS